MSRVLRIKNLILNSLEYCLLKTNQTRVSKSVKKETLASEYWSAKKQDFWPKINILKGNHCILRIPVRQKLDMILENKVVQKLKLEKMFFTKTGLLN